MVASPLERMRYTEGESALVGIMFRPPPVTEPETPLDPVVPVAALGIAGIILLGFGLKWE